MEWWSGGVVEWWSGGVVGVRGEGKEARSRMIWRRALSFV
jgi:hypothetical protein